jgi:hypothetical protein
MIHKWGKLRILSKKRPYFAPFDMGKGYSRGLKPKTDKSLYPHPIEP